MIIKYVRNQQNKSNKVSARYSYITHREKASWIYENTLERFDFAIKKRFKDKQDTTHYVVSFNRKLTEEEKKKARQIISDYFFKKFGTEYFLSIAEHEDKEYTHYHILISRHLETAKMLNSVLKAKEYKQLQRELRQLIENAGLLNEREKELNQKYLNSTEYVKQLEAWQYKDYQKALKNFLDKNFNLSDTKSFKAAAKAAAEFAAKLLEKKDLDTLREFEQHTNISFFVEKAKKRERLYVKIADKKIRVDKLSKAAKDRLINYVKAMSVITQTQQQKEQKEEKEAITIYDVIRESVEEFKRKQQLKEKKQKQEEKEDFEMRRNRFRGPGM